MTITTVNKKISNAMKDLRLTAREADGILKATRPALSNGEAKAIAGLYTRVTTKVTAPAGAQICFTPTAEKGAVEKLEKFIGEKRLPVGSNADVLRTGINDFLSRARLAAPSDKLPRSLDKLMALPLHTGPQPLGGWQQMAYVDVAKKRFYLVETRATLQDNTRVWGPLGLPAAQEPAPSDGISDARAAKLRGAFAKLGDPGSLTFQMGGVFESHLGQRFAKVELFRERHPDGYAYTAYVPVGALSPTAPRMDPNKVNTFYVERTGGFAGLTQSLGPVSVR